MRMGVVASGEPECMETMRGKRTILNRDGVSRCVSGGMIRGSLLTKLSPEALKREIGASAKKIKQRVFSFVRNRLSRVEWIIHAFGFYHDFGVCVARLL